MLLDASGSASMGRTIGNSRRGSDHPNLTRRRRGSLLVFVLLGFFFYSTSRTSPRYQRLVGPNPSSPMARYDCGETQNEKDLPAAANPACFRKRRNRFLTLRLGASRARSFDLGRPSE